MFNVQRHYNDILKLRAEELKLAKNNYEKAETLNKLSLAALVIYDFTDNDNRSLTQDELIFNIRQIADCSREEAITLYISEAYHKAEVYSGGFQNNRICLATEILDKLGEIG